MDKIPELTAGYPLEAQLQELEKKTSLTNQFRTAADAISLNATLERLATPISPNPGGEPADVVARMLAKTDQLLAIQAQQASLIQKLGEVAATSLDHARLCAAQATRATDSLKSSVKVARWTLGMAIISFLGTMALSSVQIWIWTTLQGGKATDSVMQNLLQLLDQ